MIRTVHAGLLSAVGIAVVLGLLAGCNTVGELYDLEQVRNGCQIYSIGDGTCRTAMDWIAEQKMYCTSQAETGYPEGTPKMYSPCVLTDSSGGQGEGYAYAQFICCANQTE